MSTRSRQETNVISLAGDWTLELDPSDEGVSNKWFQRTLRNRVSLPGSLPAQGIGDEITPETKWTGTIFDRSYFESDKYARYRRPGNIKVPFWLQPEKYFVGPAWYQREIDIPESWSGQRLVLFLERPHWQTRVWIDDREVGFGDSLSTPHEIAVDEPPAAGRHRITIRVDNRVHIDVGENAHSISDHTQGNWNGIAGRIELRATGRSWIEELNIDPQVASRSVTVRGKLAGTRAPGESEVTLQVMSRYDAAILASHNTEINWTSEGGLFAAQLSLGANARLWDEFDPVVYELTATFAGETRRALFGLREFRADGTQFSINGKKIFLRGTLDCCIFPHTGHPPMDVDSWRAILGKIRTYGLNHVRFHSWCPPEAAFIAGDELGLYFQVECAVWPNSTAVLGSESPRGIGDGREIDRWAISEGERILRAYGNHPCFVLMACGNEPGGARHKEYLSAWVNHFRQLDGRRLYTGTAGWPELPENQFHVIPDPRIHQWGDGLACRINGQPPATTHDYREVISSRDVPVVSHEIGQWCAYPPIGDTEKYKKPLKAYSYEIFAEDLAAHHMADQAEDFLHASGKLQALCYKEEIESALRTPGMAGFQLLGLQDFPGQGTAPVGLLDAFWEEKGYLSAPEMRRFCGPTVPLARLPKRVFTSDEALHADIEAAHFGAAPLQNAVTSWEIACDRGAVLQRGELSPTHIPLGNGSHLGRISVDLQGAAAPARYKLTVRITADETCGENHWDLWLYPSQIDVTVPPELSLVRSVPDALALLERGRTVLLIPEANQPRNDVALGFSPIFWNTACTQGQPPHTLGILCDPTHPLFAGFPTDSHSNWQWWHLITRAAALNLDFLPPGFRPLVQVVDDWFTNRRLGLILEARAGAGKLIASGIDILDEETNPVARQLLHRMITYASSAVFEPVERLSNQEIESLFRVDP